MNRFKIQSVPVQEISQELPNGTEVVMQGTGLVIEQQIKDEQDGTNLVTAVIKPLMVEVRVADQKTEAPIFKDMIKHKSWSKKVRDLLYRLHTEMGGKEADFEAFYAAKMERYCEQVQDKIDQERGL